MAESAELPSGTVTFWFTDVEDSTRRWAEDEVGMRGLMAQHDEVMLDVLDRHGGVLVKHNGDGVDAVFSSASSAVAAAVEAQDRLVLPVRMGLHTGEAEVRDRDYFGSAVNLAARIMDAGHGGQILLSSVTAGVVSGVELAGLGEHRLKGIHQPQRIFQVGTGDFAPLRVDSVERGNLPESLTEFVGRSGELAAAGRHVREHRLVTLLGVGGTGKTRLAIETSRSMSGEFPDGCWLVQLATVSVPEAVPAAVCVGLGMAIPEQGDITSCVVGRVGRQRLLVALDNCEHVLDAAGDLVESMLASCPNVHVLATSREPLMVAGEQLVPTPSLDADDAVALFVGRARAEDPSLEFDDVQMTAIRSICDRLDRLPLAIELAASRARSMTPTEIEARLDERFRLLVGGRRSRTERHQTMRGAVDWSYDLCTDLERHVFDRLSVFPGPFDLAGALAVAADEQAHADDVDDALMRLVDRSLIQRAPAHDGTTRFSLLETMRAYGHERLVERGLADTARKCHADHIASELAALSLRFVGPDSDVVLARIREYSADILAAVDWCTERGYWTPIPRLCNASITAANSGLAVRLLGRVGPALPPLGARVDGVPPLVHLGLLGNHYTWLTFGPSADVEDVDLGAALAELIEAGERLPTDAIHLLPLGDGVYNSALGAAAARRFVDSLADAPLAVRWYASFVFCNAPLTLDEFRSRVNTLRGLTDDLGGAYARRLFDGQSALLREVEGDFAAALAVVESLLPETPGRHSDVLLACRQVRLAGLKNGSITGTELRRPIEWERLLSGGSWLVAPLASIAVALDASGYQELADRAAAAIGLRARLDSYVRFFDGIASERLVAVMADVDLVPVERDLVVAEILALADDLDRAEVSAEARG